MLVSAIQQGGSTIIICISPASGASLRSPYPTPLGHPLDDLGSARQGFLCYIATSHQLSILHMGVYICLCNFIHSSHPLLPLLCPQVHSLHLHFYSFPAHRFINTIFLDSRCIWLNIWYLFFSFWLTSLCITDSRFIHLTRTDSNAFSWLSSILLLLNYFKS